MSSIGTKWLGTKNPRQEVGFMVIKYVNLYFIINDQYQMADNQPCKHKLKGQRCFPLPVHPV